MNFCSNCGEKVTQQIPPDDNMLRYICNSCGIIHYQNPKIVVGCIPVWEDKVLLCKRAIEPRKGLWTLPCGFMERGEIAEEGAIRETREEANADVEIINLHTIYSISHVSQVYLVFLAKLKNLDFHPGKESLETVLFEEEKIPWDKIAFSSIKFTLKNYFKNPDENQKPTFVGSFSKLRGRLKDPK